MSAPATAPSPSTHAGWIEERDGSVEQIPERKSQAERVDVCMPTVALKGTRLSDDTTRAFLFQTAASKTTRHLWRNSSSSNTRSALVFVCELKFPQLE